MTVFKKDRDMGVEAPELSQWMALGVYGSPEQPWSMTVTPPPMYISASYPLFELAVSTQTFPRRSGCI